MTADQILVAARLHWVQGLRHPKHGENFEMRWEQVLFHRLQGQWDLLSSGETTEGAERALGFDQPMSYFYVGRCVPSFGYHAVAGTPDRCNPTVTPFDTGGLVSEERYVRTDPELPIEDVPGFVAQNSFAGEGFLEPMSSWLTAAYDDPEDYIDGAKPRMHAVSAISLDDVQPESNGRVWSWEVRIPLQAYAAPPVKTMRIYFSGNTMEEYVDWVRSTPLLDMDERKVHKRNLYEFGVQVRDAVEAMTIYLKNGVRR